MADEKNIGKLHVEITGDSKNLKSAAKEGVESLKDVEKSAKSSDDASSFSKLRGSLDAVRSMASSMASQTASSLSNMKANVINLGDSISNRLGGRVLTQPFEKFQNTISSFSASKLEATLQIAQSKLSDVNMAMRAADAEYKQLYKSGAPTASLDAVKSSYQQLNSEASLYKSRIGLIKDAQEELSKKGNMSKMKSELDAVGKKAEKTGKKLSMSFNVRSALRFSGILLGMRSIYSIITRSVRDYISSNDQLNATIQGATQSLGVALSPAIHAAANGFATLVKWIMTAIQYFMTFMNVVLGTKFAFGTATSGAKKTAKAIGGVGKAAKEANKQVGGFDDLNIHQTQTDSGGGGGGAGAGGIEPIPVEIDTSGLGPFEAYIKKLVDLLSNKFKPAIDILKSIDFKPLIKSFKNLWSATKPILTNLGNLIVYLTNNIVAPFIKFFVEKLAPVAIDVIAGALKVLNPILEATGNVAALLWENFFGPLASWTGDVAVAGLQLLADALSGIGTWMSENIGLVENMIIVIGSFAAAWGLVTVAIGLWNAAATVGTAVTGALGAAIAFLTSPIGIAIAAIGAIIAIGLLLWKNWDEIMNWFSDIWQSFTEWVGNAVQSTLDWLQSLQDWAHKVGNELETKFKEVWDNVKTWAVETFTKIVDFIGDAVNKILDFLGPIGDYWRGIVNGMLTSLTEIIAGIKRAFNGITEFVAGIFSGDWKRAWNGVKEIFGGIVDSLAAIFRAPINIIISGINGFLGGLNKIKIPSWVPGIGGAGFNFQPITPLAKGATVKSTSGGSHTIVGEGKYDEAVIPLGQSPQFRGMKQDIASQVLAGLAEMDGSGNSDQPLVLEIDGDEFAKVIIKNINKRSSRLGRTELLV